MQLMNLVNIEQSSFSVIQTTRYENQIIKQCVMMAKQNQLLQKIKNQIVAKRKNRDNQILSQDPNNKNSINIFPIMDSSFGMPNISHTHVYDDRPLKTKFGQQFEKSLLRSALKEVEQNCSSQSYEIIRNYILNNKQEQFQLLSSEHNKLQSKLQQHQINLIIKSTQLLQTQKQLKQVLIKFNHIDEQKRRIRVKGEQLLQKQQRVYKMESSMVFKEKLFHECRKRYEREKSLFLSIQQRLGQLYKQMEVIWEEITNKMSGSNEVSCFLFCETYQKDKKCWKKEVMQKCKEQLIAQRQLLKQQEQQIQRQFQMLQSLSQQMKSLLNQQPYQSAESVSVIYDDIENKQ